MRKPSFTLIEVVFVVVILGILGSLSSEIVLRIYYSYITQRGIQSLEIRLKTVLEQVGKYTKHSIKPSVVLLRSGNYQSINDVTFQTGALLQDRTVGYFWIGKDIESQQGIWNGTQLFPGYSGVLDLSKSNGVDLNTTNSDLSYIPRIVNSITSIDPYNQTSAIYFPYGNSTGTVQERFWDNNPSSLFPISSFNSSTSTMTLARRPNELGDLYFLSYSAYGVRLNNDTLELVWNFRPWNNENFNSGQTLILVNNITQFRVWSESGGSIIRFYICGTDGDILKALGRDDWEHCKESVVVR